MQTTKELASREREREAYLVLCCSYRDGSTTPLIVQAQNRVESRGGGEEEDKQGGAEEGRKEKGEKGGGQGPLALLVDEMKPNRHVWTHAPRNCGPPFHPTPQLIQYSSCFGRVGDYLR